MPTYIKVTSMAARQKNTLQSLFSKSTRIHTWITLQAPNFWIYFGETWKLTHYVLFDSNLAHQQKIDKGIQQFLGYACILFLFLNDSRLYVTFSERWTSVAPHPFGRNSTYMTSNLDSKLFSLSWEASHRL